MAPFLRSVLAVLPRIRVWLLPFVPLSVGAPCLSRDTGLCVAARHTHLGKKRPWSDEAGQGLEKTGCLKTGLELEEGLGVTGEDAGLFDVRQLRVFDYAGTYALFAEREG